MEINLDEDSDLETVNYEEHDQAQVLLDTGASQHVIGEAHLQRLQQDMQQQMGMLAQGMQTMHQQMQQAATPPSVKLKAAPTGPPPMLGPSGWAIPQEKAPPARAWPVSPPPSVPQPAARATPAPKRAPPKNTDHMECDEGEIPSPTTPVVVLPTSQRRSPTRRSAASSSTETPAATSSGASSAHLASLKVLAEGAANATTILRGLWRLRLKESEMRNKEREARPKHMKDKTPLERWTYMARWKTHQKLVDQTSRLLKNLKEERLTEGYIHPQDKAKAEKVPQAKSKAKSKTKASKQ